MQQHGTVAAGASIEGAGAHAAPRAVTAAAACAAPRSRPSPPQHALAAAHGGSRNPPPPHLWPHVLWLLWGGGGGAAPLHIAPVCLAFARIPSPLPASKPFFRYWVDYQVLSSPSSAALAERALEALGGRRTGGPPKLDPVTAQVRKIKDYGYMHMGSWDLLLSITAKAMLAAEVLRPGQLVCIVPGCLAITRKTSLVRSLVATYGPDAAFTIVPRTFKLPEELDDWAAWVQAHPDQDTGLWMLKNNKQRGTGLRLVPTADAFAACFEVTTRPGMEGVPLHRWYLAQQYVCRPLLIGGRKFGVRLWALVPGVEPLRLYMHRRGLALFSSEPYQDAAGDPSAAAHITNYAQNENGEVWPLERLAAHVGAAAWGRLLAAMQRAAAWTFAAALRRAQEVQAQMDLPPRSCFQFFGLDYLVDADCTPWLMEVNATPSMKVEHEEARIRQVIHDEKWPVVADTYHLLGVCPQRFQQAPASPVMGLGEVEAELKRRGGFVPLTHLFPREADHPGLSIPYSAADRQLEGWMRSSRAYAAASAEARPVAA